MRRNSESRCMIMPLVSVIVPVYNQADLLWETIDSLCRQTYPNIEIIVVDDGSTDDSSIVIQRHFAERVKLIQQANSGPSAALNTGLRTARGDLIALMGGDDICAPDRVQRQVEFVVTERKDVVFCRPKLVDKLGRGMPDDVIPAFFRQLGDERWSLLRSLFFDGNFLCAPSAMLTADAVAKIGAFHEGLIQLQDYDYWLRACALEMRMGISESRDVSYRRHDANLSSEDRSFAMKAEFAYILQRFLKQAEPRVIREALGDYLIPSADYSRPLSKFERCLLLMAHPVKEVALRGAEEAIDIFEDTNALSELRANGVNLFRLLFNAMS